MLREKPMRISDLSRKFKFTTTEVRRHVTRLSEVGLIHRDLDGCYQLTPYGETALILFQEFIFLSSNMEYFKIHSPLGLHHNFLRRFSELSSYRFVDSVMVFLNFIKEKINEAKEFVWLSIDQYPFIVIDSILKSVEKGVKVRIIEQSDLTGPSVAFEDKHLLALGMDVPDVMVRVHDKKEVYLFVSDAGSAIAFPTENKFDYTGFVCDDPNNIKWSIDLFNFYWEKAVSKISSPSMLLKDKSQDKGKSITIIAQKDPVLNIQAIQNAVDNYDEVLLDGSFNLGSSTQQVYDPDGEFRPLGLASIIITKSVIIRGKGKENGRPTTKLFATGWNFPTNNIISVFRIIGKNAIVRIENLHFTDYGGGAILGDVCDRAEICDNWFTLESGIGRGTSYFGQKGGLIDAITFGGDAGIPMFRKGILIENNYLDFALSYVIGGYISRGGMENLPEYRPDENNLQNCFSYGLSLIHI